MVIPHDQFSREQAFSQRDHNIIVVPFLSGNAPPSDRKDLLSELELMKKLKPHLHVIKLIGCVTESGNGRII